MFNNLWFKKEEPKNYDGTPLNLRKSLEGVTPVDEYECPGCGEGPPEFDGSYYKGNDGYHYPAILNYESYYNGDLDIIRFDEVHRCDECNIVYGLENGN